MCIRDSCIIGIGLLEEYGCIIDFRNQQVTIPEKVNQKEVTAEIFMAEVFNTIVVYEGADNEGMEEETQNTQMCIRDRP